MPSSAQPGRHLESVDVGQHHVEHDQIELSLLHSSECRASRHRCFDCETLVAQRGRNGIDDRVLVVDHQQTLFAVVRALHSVIMSCALRG